MRLNNKGQALVMFVLIIPIILLVLVLIYDIGNALYEKNRMSNTNYLATEYALDNMGSINENDVIRYIQKNADNLNNISVTINDNEVEIYTEKKIKGLFGKSFDIDISTVKSEYKGTLNDNEKNIERIK